MALSVLKEIRKIYSSVNANEIRSLARQDLSVGLMAMSEGSFRELESFLAPPSLPEQARNEALWKIHRVAGAPPENADFVLCEPGIVLPPKGYIFDVMNPAPAIARILADHEGKELAIASRSPAEARGSYRLGHVENPQTLPPQCRSQGRNSTVIRRAARNLGRPKVANQQTPPINARPRSNWWGSYVRDADATSPRLSAGSRSAIPGAQRVAQVAGLGVTRVAGNMITQHMTSRSRSKQHLV